MIETKRLLLRQVQPDDLDLLAEWHSDPGVMELIPRGPAATADEARRLRAERAAEGERGIAVVLKATGELIGELTYRWGDREVPFSFGGLLASEAVGHGYAYEAGVALLDMAFAAGVGRVVAETDPRNGRAIEVLKRLGLEQDPTGKWSKAAPF